MVDILLVDDREDGLLALEAILSDNPAYNLVKARSGLEAISLLDTHDFAVVLLDVQMPDIDGFQTAGRIRRDIRFATIPIIFVTAINKDERYVSRGYESGAVDYIFKPFDPLILTSKVAVFAELHRKSRKIAEQARALAAREALAHQSRVQAVELENLRRYRNLANAIPHIVWRMSPDSNLEYHNDQWTLFTGLSGEESLGEKWRQAVHPEDLPGLLWMWERTIATGRASEAECRIRRCDGTYRWHWVKANSESDPDGRVVACIGTCTDIHDRKAVEDQLKKAQTNAEAASVAKTQFLANMSHEIRTPLNAIMGFTELLLDPKLSLEEKMDSVSIVRRNGLQLLKIVDEILDISKVEAGGLIIEKVETNILNLLTEIKALMQVQAAHKRIEFSVDLSKSIPSRVVTDPTRLRQILINIVGNAIKFTQLGSVNVVGRFVANMGGRSTLQFEIIDTGVGMSMNLSQRIFEPFLQGDSSTTRLYGGTGLGLALSRKLARALGGDVRLTKSRPDEGSTFLVEIEVAVPESASRFTNAEVSEIPANELESLHELEESLKGRRILLVEDAVDNQMLITHILKRTGAIVEVANNGREGVSKALNQDFEVILMDIQMPLLDGYQATQQLRRAGYKKPIIALTAHALIEEREKSLKTGCDGHLTKPINRRQLLQSLADHCAH